MHPNQKQLIHATLDDMVNESSCNLKNMIPEYGVIRYTKNIYYCSYDGHCKYKPARHKNVWECVFKEQFFSKVYEILTNDDLTTHSLEPKKGDPFP